MELIRVDPGCIVLRLSAAGLEVELELTLDQGNIVQGAADGCGETVTRSVSLRFLPNQREGENTL